MDPTDLAFSGIARQAELLREREISSAELIDLYLERIEQINPKLNAFTDVFTDSAREAAAAADEKLAAGVGGPEAPLLGVPVALKDEIDVEGLVAQHGTSAYSEPAGADAAHWRRLKQAGAILLGKTTLPELAICGFTESETWGETRNPWNTDHTTGGSSGGSGAAVAAGLVGAASASDGAGSIRIPAACCGLVGLKPTRGRISRGPDAGDSFLVTDGVLTRTVADTALGLDVLFGYEVGDATWAPRPIEPLSYAMRRDPGRLRVAFSTANVLESPVDPTAARAVRDTAEALNGLGHDVEEVDPRLPGAEVVALFIGVFAATRAAEIVTAVAAAGREPGDEEIEPLSRALLDMARSSTAVDYLQGVKELQRLARAMIAFFADWDLMLTPALAGRPLRVGACHGAMDDPLAALGVAAGFAPYSALYNVTGQPAMTLPAGFGTDGLPTAVQLVGPPLSEETLLQVAAQLETARPWRDDRPPRPLAPRPAAVG